MSEVDENTHHKMSMSPGSDGYMDAETHDLDHEYKT